MGVRFRLGLMMFLQYAIWGAWSPVLSEYLINELGFSGTQVGLIYSLLPLATIVTPFVGGQIADRSFASQKVIACLQLIGGGLLIYTSTVTNYSTMIWMMLFYCLLYAPTLALTNSVAFINLKDSEKEFGIIRVWGTIGWIVAGLILMGWRHLSQSSDTFAIRGDTLFLAGIFSIIMGFQAFSLPHTPPKKEGANPLAFLEAIKMMRNKNFLAFVIISFVVATELMFYYVLTAPFLTSDKIGLSSASVPGVMVIAQVAEIFVLAILLPYFITRIGIRNVLVMGVLAWPLRYIIFAVGKPSWLVLASLSLHGFCFVFFFAAAFIYVDTVSPRDIRHSAQSLIMLVTYGIGNYIGSLFAGEVQEFFTTEAGTNWTGVFLVPCVLTVLCAVAFLLFVKDDRSAQIQES
ncbi:MAG: MFS transporter [Candidatus Aminicenantes bacterium]|nr:MFS transporter [Candidatus Aminicenantes bacterium]MDH5383210.1 MFS transporter [Candidatus Aminicenantes bacterium]